MIYVVHITKAAENDLYQTINYIETVLKNPTAAEHLLDKAEKQINNLAVFPKANAVINDPVLKAWGIRFVTIDHYLAFYTIQNQTVYVLRFLYVKRDWLSILKNGKELIEEEII